MDSTVKRRGRPPKAKSQENEERLEIEDTLEELQSLEKVKQTTFLEEDDDMEEENNELIDNELDQQSDQQSDEENDEFEQIDDDLIDFCGDQETSPEITSPEWHDYVMSKFSDDELEDNKYKPGEKCPKVDGLRRVAELLLGDLLESNIQIITHANQGNFVTAHCELVFDVDGQQKKYSEVGDCNIEATNAPYNLFPSSIASTRAEGRALRKALKLRKTVAAEEVNLGNDNEAASPNINLEQKYENDAPINNALINAIDLICKRKGVNGDSFVAMEIPSGKLNEATFGQGKEMMVKLNNYGDGKKNAVPEHLVGYKEGWLKV